MNRVPVVAVTVCVLVVVGVSTPGLSAPERPTATEFRTAPVETLDTTPGGPTNESSGFPPGTSEAGIENATVLVTAHRTRLRETTYVERSLWERVAPRSSPNGTASAFGVRQFDVVVENGANGTEMRIASENESSTYWFADDVTATNHTHRRFGPTETLYEYTRGAGMLPGLDRYSTALSSGGVEPYLRDLDYELVETTTRDNRTRYVYASTGIDETVEPNVGDTPVTRTTESISATVVVDDRGIIRSFTARETHAVDDETVTIEQRYGVEGLGETDATTPAWVTEEIAQFDAARLDNGSVVALTHLGGKAVSDRGLLFNTPNASYSTPICGTVESGDVLYLYLTADENSNRSLHASIGDRPSVNRSFVSLGEGALSVTAWRRLVGSSDSGVQLEVSIRERPARNASRNVTTGPPPPVGG